MFSLEEANLAMDTLKILHVAYVGKGSGCIFLRLDFQQNLHLSSVVYKGDSFIPLSVRQAASEPLSTEALLLQTTLHIDENRCQISLYYRKNFNSLSFDSFRELVGEFQEIAAIWRDVFEEKDRQDLVHIPIHG